MSQEQRLGYLQQLLHNLPESTGPYGDETSATNHRLDQLRPPSSNKRNCTDSGMCTHDKRAHLVHPPVLTPYPGGERSQRLSMRISWRSSQFEYTPRASVDSMADERTASNFTWFNSGLRNRQNVGTLTWLIQIRQWVLHFENQKSKPLEQPAVAFCNIKNEIYAKVNKQVVDLTVEDLSEDEGDQDKDANPAGKDSEFNLDNNIDLGSPLLDGMLSDRQPTPDQENITASTAAAARLETRNHEPTEDDWENL